MVAEYNGSEYYLNEEIWGGNVADDVVQDEQFDENGESVYVTRVRSTTMILDGDYYGSMVFDDMSEDDIHYILDQIKLCLLYTSDAADD